MKKYIELQGEEIIKEGDEWKTHTDPDTWEPIPDNLFGKNGWAIYTDCRRPVPYSGKVAFLVTYSPMIRVVIDTTGLNDEEIDNKLIEASKAKYAYEYQQYMNDFGNNIDWEQTKEDVEVPFEDEEEPKNPGNYRFLEAFEQIEDGDEELIDGRWERTGDAALLLGPNAAKEQLYRRPITEPQYRPFVLGDVLEQGDQFRFNEGSEWRDLTDPEGAIDQSIVDSGDFRKLIK